MKAAAKSHATTSGIINREVSQTLHTAAQGALPKESSVRRTIQRERRRNLPPLPKSASEIDIEGKWRETSNGEDWLIFYESVEGERVLIYSTAQNLYHLSCSKAWYGDGTFSVTPPFFKQLYTIHGEYLGTIFPMVFCLLPKKSSETYTAVFKIIKDKMESLGMSIEIQIFRSDFETAAYSSMRSLFPQLSIECCFFHFGQANWRKISELGLRTKYVDDLDFSLKVRMFTALASLPPDSVRHAFQEIKPLLPPEAEDFALYFERTYIGQYSSADTGTDALRPLRLTWREPPFPPSIWSVYERTLGSEPRTTNFLEGWHRRISSILGQAHPNIWKFLEFLKGEQSNTELRKQTLLRGESLSKKSSKAVSREKRLQKIVSEFQMRTNNGHSCMDYLEGLAHNVTY